MGDANVTFASKEALVRSMCRSRAAQKRFRYSRVCMDAMYQLMLAVRADQITAVSQWRRGPNITTTAKFAYAGRDYEMSVCERRSRRDGKYSWVNIQTLPRIPESDLTHKALDAGIGYEEILRVLKELRDSNASKISAHSRRTQERRQQNRENTDRRRRERA